MKLTDSDIRNINQLFEDPLNAGYVLDFTNKSMRDFFESEFPSILTTTSIVLMATPK